MTDPSGSTTRATAAPFVDLDRLINSRDVCQFHNADETRRPLRQDTLRGWVRRGKLTVRGQDGRLNLYRLGDVLALLATRRKPRGVQVADKRITPM